MKKKGMISFGPGASSLILIFVVLALSTLGILSLMNSRNDIRLSERSVQVTQAVYALQTAAEEKRAALDTLLGQAAQDAEGEEAYHAAIENALPDGFKWEDGVISWEETDGFRSLYCELEAQPLGAQETESALTEAGWTQEEGLWRLPGESFDLTVSVSREEQPFGELLRYQVRAVSGGEILVDLPAARYREAAE